MRCDLVRSMHVSGLRNRDKTQSCRYNLYTGGDVTSSRWCSTTEGLSRNEWRPRLDIQLHSVRSFLNQMSKTNGNGTNNGNSDNSSRKNKPTESSLSPINGYPLPFGVRVPGVSKGVPVSGANIASDDILNEYQPSYIEAYPATETLDPNDDAQFHRIEKAIFDLLDAFSVNWEDPNYTETPKRVAKAYTEYWAGGYARRPEDEVTVFPNSSGSGDLVMVKDMQFYSMCSHHLAPFKGYGAVAYIPGENLLGLSKLGRILDIYARRFQLQERIGAQTADTLMQLIQPKGVMVVLYDVEHMCMSSRGVQMHAANTTTIATRGTFKDDADMRNQVMSLLR